MNIFRCDVCDRPEESEALPREWLEIRIDVLGHSESNSGPIKATDSSVKICIYCIGRMHFVDVGQLGDIARRAVIWNLRAEQPAQQTHRAALEQIAVLEAGQPRTVREAALGDAAAMERLKVLDAQIAGLRTHLI